jgi:hypothetical protein
MNGRIRAFLVVAGVTVPVFGGVRIARTAPSATAEDPPKVQRPSTMGEDPAAEPTQPAEEEAPTKTQPDDHTGPSDATSPAPDAEPGDATSPAADAMPSDASAPPPAAKPATPSSGERPQPQRPKKADAPESKDLLAPSSTPSERTAPPRRVLTKREQAERDAAAMARALRLEYRPPSNPARFNLMVHGMYAAAASTDAEISGRLGGGSIEPGLSWNYIAPAVTLSAIGGRLILPTEQGTEIRALMGGGPTLGLGRLALIRRGFLDLRVGYDFFHATVKAREGVVLPDGEEPPDPVDESSLAPHGPRIRLSMGLLASPQVPRRFWHGFGFSIGYQGLVGSLRGELPVVHMLTIGLVYFAGDKPVVRGRSRRATSRHRATPGT